MDINGSPGRAHQTRRGALAKSRRDIIYCDVIFRSLFMREHSSRPFHASSSSLCHATFKRRPRPPGLAPAGQVSFTLALMSR